MTRHAFYLSLILTGALTAASAHAAWKTAANYTFAADSRGYRGATDVVFVNPTEDRKGEVVYLVTELRGRILAVMKNGSTKAVGKPDDIYEPRRELPVVSAELGQTGACIDPESRSVYTTYVADNGSRMVNRVVRWRPHPQKGWQKLQRTKTFFDPFVADRSAPSHLIGHCFIDKDERLWVGVGDAQQHGKSHNVTYVNGKILRTTLDFKGLPENPFFHPQKPRAAESLVYASGFRNPFALALGPKGKLYVADNGPAVDRLVRVAPGYDYPWDGTDDSFTYDADKVWPKAIGPSDMIYIPRGDEDFPRLGGHLIITASFAAKLLALPLDENGQVAGPSKVLVRWKGKSDRRRTFTSVTRGPDGLYVAVLSSEKPGSGKEGLFPSGVYKLTAGEKKTKNTPAAANAKDVLDRAGCRGCHVISGDGNTVGPVLDNLGARLAKRLADPDYLEELDLESAGETGPEVKKAVERLKNENGSFAERRRTWVALKLLAPTLDRQESGMPVQARSLEEAHAIADALFAQTTPRRRQRDKITLGNRIKWYLDEHRTARRLLWFSLGIGITLGVGRWRKRRRSGVAGRGGRTY